MRIVGNAGDLSMSWQQFKRLMYNGVHVREMIEVRGARAREQPLVGMGESRPTVCVPQSR